MEQGVCEQLGERIGSGGTYKPEVVKKILDGRIILGLSDTYCLLRSILGDEYDDGERKALAERVINAFADKAFAENDSGSRIQELWFEAHRLATEARYAITNSIPINLLALANAQPSTQA